MGPCASAWKKPAPRLQVGDLWPIAGGGEGRAGGGGGEGGGTCKMPHESANSEALFFASADSGHDIRQRAKRKVVIARKKCQLELKKLRVEEAGWAGCVTLALSAGSRLHWCDTGHL